MPIVMYRIARAAAIEERDRLTVDELATAVCT